MVYISIKAATILLILHSTIAFSPAYFPRVSLIQWSRNFDQKSVSIVATNLNAKKTNTSGKGFGRAPPPSNKGGENSPAREAPTESNSINSVNEGTKDDFTGFASIEGATNFAKPEIEFDPNTPVEERTKAILKQKYGLRSLEERQGDIRKEQMKAENSSRMKKVKEMSDEEFDIFMVIPPSIVRIIDTFLKLGLGISIFFFILSGIGITVEAWAVTTKNSLPQNIDSFIVSVIEPNFTTGLLVLLGFSVSLGLFATAQLGSKSTTYREEP